MREGSSRRKLFCNKRASARPHKQGATIPGHGRKGTTESIVPRRHRLQANRIRLASMAPSRPLLISMIERKAIHATKAQGQVDHVCESDRSDANGSSAKASKGEEKKTMETRAGASSFGDSPLVYILMPTREAKRVSPQSQV